MTRYEQILAEMEQGMEKQNNPARPKRHPREEESRLQRNCIKWFRLQYAQLSPLLFAVPNGGQRGKITAKILIGEGVVPGVSDLILLVPRGPYASLCIEMKTPAGRQSDRQKAWQKAAEKAGNKYVICRSLDDFMNEVNTYLALPQEYI